MFQPPLVVNKPNIHNSKIKPLTYSYWQCSVNLKIKLYIITKLKISHFSQETFTSASSHYSPNKYPLNFSNLAFVNGLVRTSATMFAVGQYSIDIFPSVCADWTSDT